MLVRSGSSSWGEVSEDPTNKLRRRDERVGKDLNKQPTRRYGGGLGLHGALAIELVPPARS